MMTEGTACRLKFRRGALPGLSRIATVAGFLVAGLMAFPQAGSHSSKTDAVPLPSFEVASVRPVGPNETEMNGLYTYPGGKIVARGCWVEYLIMVAFHVQRFQIAGGPRWIDGARFDIQAKPPDSSQSSQLNPASPKLPPSDEQRQMLQSLLIDRFQLRFHRETKEGPVFLLVSDGKAPKLNPPKEMDTFPWAGGIGGGLPGGSGLRGENISMPELAERMSGWLERPVLDRTGLQGSFDFEYRRSDEDTYASSADIESSIFAGIHGIGLKLGKGKGPIETLVIDHVEQPSPN
jgi:uncharacterized protein (TIGR03435 family)